MAIKKLYLFVEGNDDVLFFNEIIKPLLYNRFNDIEIIQYAQMKKSKVDLFLVSIQTLNFDYLITADYDFAESVNDKKRLIKHRFEFADVRKIVIVITEIESWFLAGLTQERTEELNLHYLEHTDNLTKEKFNDFFARKFHSRIDFMLEIVKSYSIEEACRRNKSFNYFYTKYLAESPE